MSLRCGLSYCGFLLIMLLRRYDEHHELYVSDWPSFPSFFLISAASFSDQVKQPALYVKLVTKQNIMK